MKKMIAIVLLFVSVTAYGQNSQQQLVDSNNQAAADSIAADSAANQNQNQTAAVPDSAGTDSISSASNQNSSSGSNQSGQVSVEKNNNGIWISGILGAVLIVIFTINYFVTKPKDPLKEQQKQTEIAEETKKGVVLLAEAVEELKDSLEVEITGPVELETFMEKAVDPTFKKVEPQKSLPKLSILPIFLLVALAGGIMAFVANLPTPVRPEREHRVVRQQEGGTQYVSLPQTRDNHRSGNGGGNGNRGHTPPAPRPQFQDITKDSVIVVRVDTIRAFPEEDLGMAPYADQHCIPTDAESMEFYSEMDSVWVSLGDRPFVMLKTPQKPASLDEILKGNFAKGPNIGTAHCLSFVSPVPDRDIWVLLVYYKTIKIVTGRVRIS